MHVAGDEGVLGVFCSFKMNEFSGFGFGFGFFGCDFPGSDVVIVLGPSDSSETKWRVWRSEVRTHAVQVWLLVSRNSGSNQHP